MILLKSIRPTRAALKRFDDEYCDFTHLGLRNICGAEQVIERVA